jgi:hypothetical protein
VLFAYFVEKNPFTTETQSRSKREHPEDSKKKESHQKGRTINRSSQPFIPSVVEPHLSASSEPSEVNLFCNGATRKTRAIYHTGR